MPDGSMLPHGSAEPGTGVARWRDQRSAPVVASKAYTVSFSVATISGGSHNEGLGVDGAVEDRAGPAGATLPAGGDVGSTPLRPASWSYVAQSTSPVAPEDAAPPGAVVAGDDWWS